jgi:lactate dehydrogenase-like 2-hydroxyacid dehydrogenase
MSETLLFVDLDRDWASALIQETLAGEAGRALYLQQPPLGERCQQLEVLSPFISSQVGKAELERLPALRLIATRSTGFDHIDLNEARRRGVTVCNVPTYGDNTVAEHSFALILSLSPAPWP